jgi:hypothetical protein
LPPGTANAGGRFEAVAFGFAAGFGSTAGAAGVGVTTRVSAPATLTAEPGYGAAFSGEPSCLYWPLGERVTWIVGLPVSTTRVPGWGDWLATMLAAKPSTDPLTFHEKPASSSVPLAKTKA